MSDRTADDQLQLRPGDVLAGRYCLGRVIASGGMGYVLAATHRELGTAYAVKVLKLKFAHDKVYLARFRREALAAARLHSENIVRAVDFGRAAGSGAPFLVMEYLDGNDLATTLEEAQGRREALPMRDVCDYTIQACSGLAVAHAAGIVHRDLKPANLFLTRKDDGSPCVKVLDFGISKHGTSEAMSLTSSREVLGSPPYMSPEQLTSPHSVDVRTDVWSLGVVLFELLTGQIPFDGKTFGETFLRIQTGEAPPLLALRPDLPPGLAEAVGRCLRKNPDERFADMVALAKELATFASPSAEHYLSSLSSNHQLDRLLAVTQATPHPDRADPALDADPDPALDPAPALDPTPNPATPSPTHHCSPRAFAHAPEFVGPLTFARRLFGTKTFAPLEGDAERTGRLHGTSHTNRIMIAAALAGAALACVNWALLGNHGPAPQTASQALPALDVAEEPHDLPAKAQPDAAPPEAFLSTAADGQSLAVEPVKPGKRPAPTAISTGRRLTPTPARSRPVVSLPPAKPAQVKYKTAGPSIY